MELTEVWLRFELSDICFTVPEAGKRIASPIRLGEDKVAAEVGVVRIGENSLRFYFFPKSLHKFGLEVKRVACLFNIEPESSQVILLRGKQVDREEHLLDPLIQSSDSRKRLNFFMHDFNFKLQDENCASFHVPRFSLIIYVDGITDSFQCQLMDSESDDPLINLLFLNSFGDVEFHVSSMHHSPVKAPKVILAARSPILAGLFAEKSRTALNVSASAPNFRSVLNFLVRGRLSCGVNAQVSALADAFEIKSLQEICRVVKAVDPVTDVLEMHSLLEESLISEESIEKSGRLARLSTFRLSDVLNDNGNGSGNELRLMTEALVSSKKASTCLIRHVRPIALEWSFPGSVRWPFEDRAKQFRFHATLHKDRDEGGPFVAISLRNFERAPTYDVKRVSYMIRSQGCPQTDQGQTIGGELETECNESQMKRWIGRQRDCSQLFSLNALPLIEFNILIETTIPNYKFSMRDSRYSSDILRVLNEKKWPDVELNIGDKLFSVHRAILGKTELALCLYKFLPPSPDEKPSEDPAQAFKKLMTEFPEYLQHAMEPVQDFTIPQKFKNISPHVFQSILTFIYGRKLTVSPFNQELLAAAEDLQVKTLKTICRACAGLPSDFESLMRRIEWL